MHCLFKETIPTGLGEFELQISSSSAFVVLEPEELSTVLLTAAHRVTILQTPAPTAELPSGMSIDFANAWLFYIYKRNAVIEQLTIAFSLKQPQPGVDAGPDTGQWLVAIEFENGIHQVHIGTPDEDWYASQIGGAWIPQKLSAALQEDEFALTRIEPNGLSTQVPEMLAGERFYFHYVIAQSPRRKSLQYPEEWDISTWEAVDQPRKKLEEAWQQHTKKPLP
ncbi:hypothetical protein F0P96_12510 [Hymenobacter busanensis]|uniref:Uncharacterized protein n=1 Tax=Hymenobacter busanensis TaxID=2607656 RepID=A0A7L4ZVY2_9BACT|nr:hypothetical protein [Hymenobacter busanensis]KAA9332295.1 hypothetical protein F0P96_12510 [Hymenobacter busanensis]QHJ07368.1 hypothetical protein GUY19_08765 [Hymenobacter busanensis]